MPNFGIGVAIISAGKVLLTRREDFEVWCLPGGGMEPGETFPETARREAKEEIGLEVLIERLVGIYSMPKGAFGGQQDILFAGSPVGGTLSPDPREVVETGWFGLDDLPDPISPWMIQEIRDALNGVGGSAVWRQDFVWPFPPEVQRKELYRLRDESGLSRRDFFLKHISPDPFVETLQVTDIRKITGE